MLKRIAMGRFDRDFWEQRYKEQTTAWDIGYPSTPLKAFIDQLTDKELRILIPGAGNGYEAEYMHQQGFHQVHILDVAAQPLNTFKDRVPGFPSGHLIQDDFFAHKAQYDLILEQTFFCSLDPVLRSSYANKMDQLLNTGGKLVGLLFDFELIDEGPPFGGSKQEYFGLFAHNFTIHTLEPAFNSIEPRQGHELFMILQKKR